MRFAAVSDIHGNLPALEAVIADMAEHSVEAIVNLGDSLSGPLWPVETARLLMDLDWPTLAGNHERQLLTQSCSQLGETDAATLAVLTPDIIDWMASLPPTLEYAPDVLLCHGTPEDDHRYWLHRGRRGAMREATIPEIEEEAAAYALTLCGHTHLSRVVQLSGDRIVANTGSVGMPAYEEGLPSYQMIETRAPSARYLIAQRQRNAWTVHLKAVDYDFECSARKAERAGRPSWAHALRTGRVMRAG